MPLSRIFRYRIRWLFGVVLLAALFSAGYAHQRRQRLALVQAICTDGGSVRWETGWLGLPRVVAVRLPQLESPAWRMRELRRFPHLEEIRVDHFESHQEEWSIQGSLLINTPVGIDHMIEADND